MQSQCPYRKEAEGCLKEKRKRQYGNDRSRRFEDATLLVLKMEGNTVTHEHRHCWQPAEGRKGRGMNSPLKPLKGV